MIDLIFSNEESMIADLEHQSPLGKSDHSTLTFRYNCYLDRKSIPGSKYCYDKGDYIELNNAMSIDWCAKFTEYKDDANEQWNTFKHQLIAAQKKFIPQKPIGNQANWKSKGSIPLNRQTIGKIHKKHRAWQRYHETKNPEHYKLYCRQRNQVKSLIRKTQKAFEKEIAKDAKKSPKKLWSYIRSRTKTTIGVSPLIKPGTDDLTVTETEQAEILSDYFTSVFTVEPPGAIPTLPNENTHTPLKPNHITPEIVCAKLRKLNQNKSPGPDSLHPHVLN